MISLFVSLFSLGFVVVGGVVIFRLLLHPPFICVSFFGMYIYELMSLSMVTGSSAIAFCEASPPTDNRRRNFHHSE